MRTFQSFLLLVAGLTASACGSDPLAPPPVPHPVGAAGGTVVEDSGRVTLVVPPGALDHDIDLTITPSTRMSAVAAYELGPDGTEFKARVHATLAYDPSALPAGASEDDLHLFTVGAAGLQVEVPNVVVDKVAHTVSGDLTHFSVILVEYSPYARTFSVRLTSATQAELRLGATGMPILRAHVGGCPAGVTCQPHVFGCTEADFQPLPVNRPPQTDLVCLTSGTPVAACGGGGATTLTDDLRAAGFYCYRNPQTLQTIELYSFGVQTPPTLPPPGFTADAHTSDGSVALAWIPIQGLPGDITGYLIVRGGTTSFTIDGAGAGSYTDNAVSPGTTYTYEIYAVNAFGRSPTAASATVTAENATPGVPGAPLSFRVLSTTNRSVTLDWSSIPGASTIQLSRAVPPQTWTLPAATLTFTDGNVGPSMAYTYTVRGVSASGDLGPRRTVRAQTLNGSPCMGIQLSFNPTSVALFPGATQSVTVLIQHIDSGNLITVTAALDPASPLQGKIDFGITGANPTNGNTQLMIHQSSSAGPAQGNLLVHASDGFGAVCDTILPVSTDI